MGYLRAILLAALLTSIFGHSAFSGQIVKVLSLNFNSEVWSVDLSQNLRDLRAPRMVEWIKANDPDIILIQEGWNYHKDPTIGLTLARLLPYDLAYIIDIGVPNILYDSNIILAKKKFKMSDEVDTKLPHSAAMIGDGKTWRLVFGSVSFSVSARLRLDNGDPLYVVSTHYVANNNQERLEQTQAAHNALVQQIKRNGDDLNKVRVIFGGDTNSEPHSPAIQYMTQQSYQDTWALAHPHELGYTLCGNPAEPKFNPFVIGSNMIPDQSGPLDRNNQRIDYVFTRGPNLKTLASTLVFTSPERGIWMSDHYGVLSTLGFDGAAAEVPNPVYDNDKEFAPTTLFEITDPILECEPVRGQCLKHLPDLDVWGPRGLTVLNRTYATVVTGVDGPTRIFTDDWAALSRDLSSAFVFNSPGEYKLTLRVDHNFDDKSDWYVAKVHVHQSDWFPPDVPKGRKGSVPASIAVNSL